MAKILIEPAKTKSILGQQESLESTLKRLSQDVDSVRSGLRFKIAGQQNISQRLREAAEQITRESQSTFAMRSGLEEVIVLYEQTESGNRDQVALEQQSGVGSAAKSGPAAGQPSGGGDLEGEGSAEEQPSDGRSVEKKGPTAEADMRSILKDKGAFKKLSSFEDAHSKDLKNKKFYWDPTTGKVAVDSDDAAALEEFKKHNSKQLPVDVRLASIGTSGAVNFWEKQGEHYGKYAGGDYRAAVGELRHEAGAYAGLLGIGATLGASYSVFTSEAKGYLGGDDLQLHGKVGVDVGKLEAKASASAGLVDQDGNFNPNLYGGVSAEAIAGEITGSVGVKALGTDVSLEGGLNYGIGAHANVGLHDGKLSVDIGATLGVGASVKLDVDVSGTVNAIGEGIGNLVSGTRDFLFGWM